MLEFVINKAKGQSQNGCSEKTKHAKFSEKQTFLTPLNAHRFENSPFCLITDKFKFRFMIEV